MPAIILPEATPQRAVPIKDEELVRGENFLKLADHVLNYYNRAIDNPLAIRDGDIVYSDTKSLLLYSNILNQRSNLIIITHNSDYGVYDGVPSNNELGIDSNILDGCFKYWFTSNSYSNKENIHPIPIGFENKRWDPDGLKTRTANNLHSKVPTKTGLLIATVGTNPVKRALCLSECTDIDCVDCLPCNLKFNDYIDKLLEYKFIISPNGRGVDCVRTWEAFLLERIPVIKNEYPLKRLFEDAPVLYVNEWTDLNDLDLNEIYNRLSLSFDDRIVTQSYWDNKIKKVIHGDQ